jgi:hypothetical protein
MHNYNRFVVPLDSRDGAQPPASTHHLKVVGGECMPPEPARLGLYTTCTCPLMSTPPSKISYTTLLYRSIQSLLKVQTDLMDNQEHKANLVEV